MIAWRRGLRLERARDGSIDNVNSNLLFIATPRFEPSIFCHVGAVAKGTGEETLPKRPQKIEMFSGRPMQ